MMELGSTVVSRAMLEPRYVEFFERCMAAAAR
jgi:hypothetical protein